MESTSNERIVKTPGACGGTARIAGHRVRVQDIVFWHEHQGMSPDQIVSEIPAITSACCSNSKNVNASMAEGICQSRRDVFVQMKSDGHLSGSLLQRLPAQLRIQ